MQHSKFLSRIVLAVVLLLPGAAFAQGVVDPGATNAGELDQNADAGQGSHRKTGSGVTPLIAPIPFKNTQVGWGLMLMGGVIHRFDKDTTIKPSTGMVGGFYTENGSWGVMALEAAKLAHDTWRLRALVSHMEIRYDYYGTGEDAGLAGKSVGLQQNMNVVVGAALRRVVPGVYLGGTAMWMNTSIAIRDTSGLGLPPAAGDTSEMSILGFGVQGEMDTRNDDYWPTQGSFGNLRAFFLSNTGGDERSFQRYFFTWSQYTPIREKRLMAASNITICGANNAPFWSLCAVGSGRAGLRGYTQGRYRDSVMTTVQAELRYHTAGRFGGTLFGGFGQVAPTLGDIFSAKILPAGGVGVRYQLTRHYPMHLRFDYSLGEDGSLFYFGVAEAF